MARVRITKQPKGMNADVFPEFSSIIAAPEVEVNNTLKPVPRFQSTLEAEKGETVVTNLMKDGIPEHYVIGGKDHSKGGTPLNLPNNSFVFSKDKDLAIDTPEILRMFGKSQNKSYTPADIAKQYKINDYRRTLADPTSDDIQIRTAERMIQNYVNKLGALAMVQESMKGFQDGVPALSQGYLGNIGINPADLYSTPQTSGALPPPVMQKGGPVIKKGHKVRYNPQTGANEIIDKSGNVVGYINAPQQVQTQQTGGQPSTTGKATKVQNIPEDAIKWDESAEGYDESQIQPGHYIKKSDGRWYKVAGYKAAPYNYNFEDPRLTGTGGDLQEAYGRLEQMITDPNNDKLRSDLIKKHRTNLENTKPNPKTGLTQDDIDKALAMSDDEIISNFLEMQKQVFATNASGIGGKGMDESDSWDKDRSNYEKTVTELGFTPLQPWQQAAFQSTYIGLNDLSSDPSHKELLQDFRMAQEGRDDENLSGLRTGSISQIDGWVGNTTIGQGAIYKPVLKDLDIKEVPEEEVPGPEVAPTLDVEQQPAPVAPWWLQDIIKTSGAAGDLARIKKYDPWQATPDVFLPTPTFYDPTRELAASAEIANIASQATTAFAGPQATGARLAKIQGDAARNAADVLGRYNNLNVGVANQFETMKAQILNQDAMNKANLATQLYDKNVIANQQFDNAKAMARQNLRQSYMDAITNRWQTQALNELYPQYSVDPSVGGALQFTHGRDLEPTAGPQANLADKFQEYKSMNPGVDDNVIYKMAAADMGVVDNSPLVDPGFIANYTSLLGQ